MQLSRILLCSLVAATLVTILAETSDSNAAGKRRRRRRHRRRRGPDGQLLVGPQDGVRRTIRHAKGRTTAEARGRRAEFVRRRLRKAKLRVKDKMEGMVRLVDGRAEWEGNVQIYHDGKWGGICDDEWDSREGDIVCKALGFADLEKVTYNGYYGHIRGTYWLDNLFCNGAEKNLTDCRHDGWGKHDCQNDESAGVVCKSHFSTTTPAPDLDVAAKDQPKQTNLTRLDHALSGKIKLQVLGGRNTEEGRVEIMVPGSDTWGLICGDGWSLLEAMVVCRQLGFGYAQAAMSTGYFGGNASNIIVSGLKCTGNEETIDQCLHDTIGDVFCPAPDSNPNSAEVTCVKKMADLVPDIYELARSTHLEDKQLFFLSCAMEENCLASSAVVAKEQGYGWHLETRRLMRFTARIVNQGDEAFRPFLPKQYWEWHACHMHYHSMEVFAHYDIIDKDGKKVAEGHKASFCLEDNNCLPDVTPTFKCANYGDQGISPGCTDTYAYNIDCQWVDITDLDPGTYTFKLSVNPEFKVAEKSFDNNAAICELIYSTTNAWLGNCTLGRP